MNCNAASPKYQWRLASLLSEASLLLCSEGHVAAVGPPGLPASQACHNAATGTAKCDAHVRAACQLPHERSVVRLLPSYFELL